VVAEYFPGGGLAGLATFELVQRGPFYSLEGLAQAAGGDEADMLIHPEADADLPGRLLDVYLHSPGWNVWRLDSVLADGILARALTSLATSHSLRGLYELNEYLPKLGLAGTFNELLASRSANFRSEVRRRRRGLERRAGSLRLHVAESTEELLAALEILFDLHNRRRSQKKSIGIFEEEATRSFHKLVAQRMSVDRRARVYLLVAGEQPIAALYGFQANETFFFFQSGFDPAWSDASPGTVLMSSVVEDCIRRGLKSFDFLRGEEGYKSRWGNEGRFAAKIRLGRGSLGSFYFRIRARLRSARDKVLAVGTW
jgi:CelD/BcsL family acetyltransferase involved in cellulose biosynthesis